MYKELVDKYLELQEQIIDRWKVIGEAWAKATDQEWHPLLENINGGGFGINKESVFNGEEVYNPYEHYVFITVPLKLFYDDSVFEECLEEYRQQKVEEKKLKDEEELRKKEESLKAELLHYEALKRKFEKGV